MKFEDWCDEEDGELIMKEDGPKRCQFSADSYIQVGPHGHSVSGVNEHNRPTYVKFDDFEIKEHGSIVIEDHSTKKIVQPVMRVTGQTELSIE